MCLLLDAVSNLIHALNYTYLLVTTLADVYIVTSSRSAEGKLPSHGEAHGGVALPLFFLIFNQDTRFVIKFRALGWREMFGVCVCVCKSGWKHRKNKKTLRRKHCENDRNSTLQIFPKHLLTLSLGSHVFLSILKVDIIYQRMVCGNNQRIPPLQDD